MNGALGAEGGEGADRKQVSVLEPEATATAIATTATATAALNNSNNSNSDGNSNSRRAGPASKQGPPAA